jgi:YggT family protein
MPNNYLTNPLTFLVEVVFSIYITIVALRLIMQWAQWEYHHPLVQLIIKATQVPVKFLRRFIPPLGKWDSATIILLLALTFVKLILISTLQAGPGTQGLFIGLLLADVFSLFITLFTFSIIIEVVLSWVVPPHTHNPITPLIHSMNEPLLRPIRQKLPMLGGIDLSPLIVILGLQVLSMLVLPILIMAP